MNLALPTWVLRGFYRTILISSQKILNTDYTSLSLFGLCFTYVTGIVVILASYIAEPLLSLLSSRCKYEEHKYLEWAANSTLQLQRLAYQGLGSGKWTNYTGEIPKTRPEYFLADLARAYPPEDGSGEVLEIKPTTQTTSTTTPSVPESSANLRVSEQSPVVPSLPVSAVSSRPVSQAVEPIPQAAEPIPQAVSPIPQAVSPISQPSAV